MQKMSRLLVVAALGALTVSAPVLAQWTGGPDRTGMRDQNGGNGVGMHDAIGAAILSDVAADRQAERDAKRQPYTPPASTRPVGNITTAKGAETACGKDAAQEMGPGAHVVGVPMARTMATGWEVQGQVQQGRDGPTVPFICSVRNGSITGMKLN